MSFYNWKIWINDNETNWKLKVLATFSFENFTLRNITVGLSLALILQTKIQINLTKDGLETLRTLSQNWFCKQGASCEIWRFRFGGYKELRFWYMTPYSLPEFSYVSTKLTVLLDMQSVRVSKTSIYFYQNTCYHLLEWHSLSNKICNGTGENK